MKDLVIITKFPLQGRVKSRLGSEIGYRNSAKIAAFLLEDLVEAASNVCNVTIVTSYNDAELFKVRYPDWRVYASAGGITTLFADAVRRRYSDSAEKLAVTCSDIAADEQEIELWFRFLDKYNFLYGLNTRGNNFYMFGYDKVFGNKVAERMPRNPNLLSFTCATLTSLLAFPRTRAMERKTDINTFKDLEEAYKSMWNPRTRDYADFLVKRYS